MSALDGPAGPSMATRSAIDGPVGPVVAGDHLRRDRPTLGGIHKGKWRKAKKCLQPRRNIHVARLACRVALEYCLKDSPRCTEWIDMCYKLKHKTAPTNNMMNSYFYRLPRLWNSIPIIDLSNSLPAIKSKPKNYFWHHFIKNFDNNNFCTFFYLCMSLF